MTRLTLLTLAACLVAGTAEAQFNRADPATGETYHVELSYGWWGPEPTISAASEGLGIPPTTIDFVDDLGIVKKRMRDFRLVLRPAKKHKFDFEWIPIKYAVDEHILTREIIFNGQAFTVGIPVNVEATFNTLRFGYEYDFLYYDRGFLGFVLDTKVTQARIDFDSPITSEFAEATAPIPAIGFHGRGYVARNVAVGGEMTFFAIPGGQDRDYDGSYYDYDFYGTVNFRDNVGVTGGWRRLDLDYTVKNDFGALDLKGFYVQGVVRF
jgi:hypothetical protein